MTSIDRLALSIPFFLIGMTVLGKGSKGVLPDRIEVIGIELIKVNPGNFTMGVKNLHPAIEPYDGPRRVEITQPFYLAVNETTQASWNLRMDKNPSRFKGDQRPVEQVTWKQSMAFCQSLNEEIKNFKPIPKGMIFRLPSEAEWEFAARAGTQSVYFFGDKPDSITDYAWISENSGARTQPVKRRKPTHGDSMTSMGTSANGAWTAMENALKKLIDPLLEWKNMDKVNRGGSWDSCEDCCKTGRRTNFGKDYQSERRRIPPALGFELEGM